MRPCDGSLTSRAADILCDVRGPAARRKRVSGGGRDRGAEPPRRAADRARGHCPRVPRRHPARRDAAGPHRSGAAVSALPPDARARDQGRALGGGIRRGLLRLRPVQRHDRAAAVLAAAGLHAAAATPRPVLSRAGTQRQKRRVLARLFLERGLTGRPAVLTSAALSTDRADQGFLRGAVPGVPEALRPARRAAGVAAPAVRALVTAGACRVLGDDDAAVPLFAQLPGRPNGDGARRRAPGAISRSPAV